MVLGHIHSPGTYSFLKGDVWSDVIGWLSSYTPKPSGEYELFNGCRAIVASEALVSPDKGVFEAHRRYLDVHYCVAGAEIVQGAPAESLAPTMRFNEERDYRLFESPSFASEILLTPGMFAVFFPEDAHMPKISNTVSAHVDKIVIKIPINLL